MNKLLIISLLALGYQTASATSLLETFGSGANAFTMDFVTIGNPGNTADTTGSPNPAGSVAYTYSLGKYEVSRDMINKANAAASLGITLEDMTYFGGNGVNRPATGVSWNDAARFVNYLNTIRGYQPAYNFTTSGANENITLWRAGQYNGSNQFRHKDAYYFLPSVDEWYKAAYGNLDGTWNNYATGSDSAPTAVASGTEANTAVYGTTWDFSGGPADINNAGGLSPWGTMGQGGNVWEWIETAIDGSNNTPDESREVRGGAWALPTYSGRLDSSWRSEASPTIEYFSYGGFRVASIPETSSLSLLAVGGVVVALRRRRR